MLQALEPCVFESGSTKLALIALCRSTTNSECIATHTDPGVPPISVETLRQAIRTARDRADIVVVMLHWGREETPYPVPESLDSTWAPCYQMRARAP